jgi:hypothetical protein
MAKKFSPDRRRNTDFSAQDNIKRDAEKMMCEDVALWDLLARFINM